MTVHVKCQIPVQAFSLECVPKKNSFLISQPKHMLWVHKRSVSMRRFF